MRSRGVILFLLMAAFSASSTKAAEAPDFAKVQIVTTRLTPGLAMLVGSGGNIAVSTGANGPIIVDDQFAPLAPKIKAAIKVLQDAPVRFVINTHHHFDHVGGNQVFGSAGAIIVAHDNVRKRMSVEQILKLQNELRVPAAAPEALPVLTFADGVTLHWNDETIRIEHVLPAHTDGDAHVWFERANVVHMGDTFVNGFYPLVDVDGGGHVDGFIDSANRVLARAKPDTRIIPGHGPLATLADLKKFRDMLVDVRKRIATGIASGKSMDAFIAAKPLADLDAEWGDGFLTTNQTIMLMWTDLSREPKR